MIARPPSSFERCAVKLDLPEPRRILVTSASGLGDLIFATPLFGALRRRYPRARLDVFTMFESAAAVARAQGVFDEVICQDLLGGSRIAALRALWRLRRARYDLHVLTFPSNRAHYNVLARLVGAKVTIGHDYLAGSALRYGRFLLSHRVRQSPDTHAVEENLKLARAVGCRELPEVLDIGELGVAESEWLATAMGHLPRPWIGVHPGSDTRKNHNHRRWPAERFAELLPRLVASTGGTAIVVLGPNEQDQAAQYRGLGAGVVVLTGQSLARVAAVLRQCAVFLSCDSGIGHLAAACGVPSVQVLGPTNPGYIHPWGVPYRVVRKGLPCSPCFEYSRAPLSCHLTQPYQCVGSLAVGAVQAACLELLGRESQARKGAERTVARAPRAPGAGVLAGAVR